MIAPARDTPTRSPHIVVDARMAGDSGIGTYISNLLPRIVRRRPNWQFTILGRAPQLGALDGAPNVQIRACESRIYTLSEQIEIAAKCPRASNVFWSPNYNIPLAYRGRLVVTVHDVAHLAAPEFTKGTAKQVYARTMFGAVRRRATTILFDTAFSRREFTRLVGEPSGDSTVVHLGVEKSWRCAHQLPAPRDRPYIVYVGNVKPHKNLGVLIQAFARLGESIAHDLVIIGRREGLRTADRSIDDAAAALGGRVEFTGEVPFAQLQAFVAHASLLVAPSLYEGFGFPPLEAMAAGVPSLVSRIETHQEVCGDAVAYFDPRDAADVARGLVGLLGDESCRRMLVERGSARVAAFTWERCTETTLAALERALA
jgi:glycosyltransferase involved in cell wall biosynthesis